MSAMSGINGVPFDRWSRSGPSDASVSAMPADALGEFDVDLTRDWSGLLPDDGMTNDPEREQARLEAEIAAARARVAIAKHRSTEISAALRAEVLASQEELADMERAHAEALEAVRTDARERSAAVLAAARLEVAAIAASADHDPDPEPEVGHEQ